MSLVRLRVARQAGLASDSAFQAVERVRVSLTTASRSSLVTGFFVRAWPRAPFASLDEWKIECRGEASVRIAKVARLGFPAQSPARVVEQSGDLQAGRRVGLGQRLVGEDVGG